MIIYIVNICGVLSLKPEYDPPVSQNLNRLLGLKGKNTSIVNPEFEKFGESYYDFMEKAYPVNPEEANNNILLKRGVGLK